MKVKIGSLRPNPFRNTARYPIRRTKVDELKRSILKTGFWDNIIGRVVNGLPERAYGEHRHTALMEEFGPDYEIDLIVRDLSDEAMLKILADENMSVWEHLAAVEHETIRAVVEAYAAGKIILDKPAGRVDQVRYAPSFRLSSDLSVAQHSSHPYTVETIAKFLEWLDPKGKAQDRVVYSLLALEFIEEGLLTEIEFDGLSTGQSRALVIEARRARKYRLERAEESGEREHYAQLAEDARIKAAEAETPLEREEADRDRIMAARLYDDAERKEEQWKKDAIEAAKKVGAHLSARFKDKDLSINNAQEVAEKVAPKAIKNLPPDINTSASKMAGMVFRLLTGLMHKQLRELVEFREHIRPVNRKRLAAHLRKVAETLLSYADRLTEEQPSVDEEEMNDATTRTLKITNPSSKEIH